MRIHIDTETQAPSFEPRVGNVYARRGGRGMARGEMMVLLHITDPEKVYRPKHDFRASTMALMLIVDRNGEPCGTDTYGLHYLEDKCPIAFVEGLDAIDLTMRSI